MDNVSDDFLIAEIMRALEIDHQYVRWVEAQSEDAIARIRHCGRKAGRVLGYKVETISTDPAQRDDGKSAVFIVVIESTEEERARIAERSRLLINNAMYQILS